jgi:hypothetical protein
MDTPRAGRLRPADMPKEACTLTLMLRGVGPQVGKAAQQGN